MIIHGGGMRSRFTAICGGSGGGGGVCAGWSMENPCWLQMRGLLASQHGAFRMCCVVVVGIRGPVHACSWASLGFLWLWSRWHGLSYTVSGCWCMCVGECMVENYLRFLSSCVMYVVILCICLGCVKARVAGCVLYCVWRTCIGSALSMWFSSTHCCLRGLFRVVCGRGV
jgi:hypothetical protein